MLSSNQVKKFWQKVYIRNYKNCWNWHGALNKDGYGFLSINKKLYLAHRISFLIHTKSLSELHVLHTCDNRRCVNPQHLFQETQKINNNDMAAKGRSAKLFGIDNPNAKLDLTQLKEIKQFFLMGIRPYIVAKRYNISWTWANELKIRIDKGIKLW